MTTQYWYKIKIRKCLIHLGSSIARLMNLIIELFAMLFNVAVHLGLALLTLSWDKNWDSHSPMNGYPSFYPRIALVAPSPDISYVAILRELPGDGLLCLLFGWVNLFSDHKQCFYLHKLQRFLGLFYCESSSSNVVWMRTYVHGFFCLAPYISVTGKPCSSFTYG